MVNVRPGIDKILDHLEGAIKSEGSAGCQSRRLQVAPFHGSMNRSQAVLCGLPPRSVESLQSPFKATRKPFRNVSNEVRLNDTDTAMNVKPCRGACQHQLPPRR